MSRTSDFVRFCPVLSDSDMFLRLLLSSRQTRQQPPRGLSVCLDLSRKVLSDL
jgi:hypothetical protein